MNKVNPVQLKALVRNVAKEKNIPAQLVLKHFMMDRLLEAIAESEYKTNFVLKGGFLVGSRYGIENRTTQDIDTTIQQIAVSEEKLREVFNTIFAEPTVDGIKFELKSIRGIREGFQYDGFEVKLKAQYERIQESLKIDVTVGDSIFPPVHNHTHPILFGDREINIAAYPTEQILSEKLSAFYALGSINTRSKDLYDIFTITKMEQLNDKTLEKSIRKTFDQRGLTNAFNDYYSQDFPLIKNSDSVKRRWTEYTQTNSFANGISFEEVIDTIENLTVTIIREENKNKN